MQNEKEVTFFWQWSTAEALDRLSASPSGLHTEEIGDRIRQYGRNTTKSTSGNSPFLLFLSQFKSPITILLMVAAFLSFGLRDIADATIILCIILASALLGFWQEKGAANAVTELLKLVQLQCRVLRDGQEKDIAFEALVPGDVVVLSAGDIIPGDCLLLESEALFVDQAAFTGETFPVEKKVGTLPGSTPLAERSNTLFTGASVVSGKASALVVKTGTDTEFGKISARLQSKIPETDFEKGIRKFGYLLMEVTLLLVIVIFAVNVFLHKPVLESFLFSLALAVGLTPQLLPAIISVNLSAGAKRMAKLKVIVKRLSSIENIGSMNILCSDKTGTITQGKVNLKDVTDAQGNPSKKAMEYTWLNASLQKGFRNPVDEAIRSAYDPSGDSYSALFEVPYDFSRKRLTVVVSSAEQAFAITKGAVNSILAVCDRIEDANGAITDLAASLQAVEARYSQLSASGFRTLGIAYKPVVPATPFGRDDEKGMIFLGFVTLFDPPKPDVDQVIAKLANLGVKLKIITGDNALVAKSLAQQIGIAQPKILTGAELRKTSNTALLHKAVATDIFAEVEPDQKERIIIMLKRAGNVVGFMGDGINDAPALHAADVGISVDTAVDVAKQAADIVLLSDGLDVVTNGIVEGRRTFANTMKYIFMATSANFGNMFSMAGASLFLPFLPLLPKQILLTNLLTDFPEMAIATDNVDASGTRLPQRWDLAFIRRFMIVFGLLSSVFDFLTFGVLLLVFHAGEATFRTAWFTESVLSATLIVLVVRTRLPFFKSLPGKYLSFATAAILLVVLFLPVTPAAVWFGFVPLPLPVYFWIVSLVLAYVVAAEILKHWFYGKTQKSVTPA